MLSTLAEREASGLRDMYSKNPDFLSLISRPRGTSRIELARITGLSPSSVGNLVRELIGKGILAEEDRVETSRGRRPILLKPAADLGFLVGVDIGMAYFRAVVTTIQGDVVRSRELPSPAQGPVHEAMDRILAAIDSVLVEANVPREKLLAMGISHSAGCDPETGVCLYWHAAMHWKGTPLRGIFADRYRVPVYIDDCVHCMALAEKEYGVAQDEDTFLFVNVGYGVGGGLFLNGELYRGASGIAGELGHVIIVPGGTRCTCGNFGCLEALASGRALTRAAQAALDEDVTTRLRDRLTDTGHSVPIATLLREAADQGDRVARRLIRQAGEYLGIAVANLLNLLNPPLIVLGGGVVSALGDLLEEDILRESGARAFEVAFQRARIVRSAVDSLGAARGAALLATRPTMERLFHETGVGFVSGKPPHANVRVVSA